MVRLPAGVLRGVLTAARLGLQGAALAARWADIGAGAEGGGVPVSPLKETTRGPQSLRDAGVMKS